MDHAQGTIMKESPEEFAGRLGLPFSNYLLLSRALTHRSYLNEHPEALEDNERLEFLGDAVLDFLVAVWLYNRFPEMSEGDMTRLRAALVGTKQLAEFAIQINLSAAIRLGHGEDAGGGRHRTALLCATLEAIIGALYLDSGIEAVRQFMEPLLAPAAEQILIARKDVDSKSHLQEWAQSRGHGLPSYKPVSIRGPDHAKTFVFEVCINGKTYGRGDGPSKQAASKEAARAALTALGLDWENEL